MIDDIESIIKITKEIKEFASQIAGKSSEERATEGIKLDGEIGAFEERLAEGDLTDAETASLQKELKIARAKKKNLERVNAAQEPKEKEAKEKKDLLEKSYQITIILKILLLEGLC